MIVSVVAPEALPAGSVAGLKLAVALIGKPDAEKLTAVVSAPPCVPKLRAKLAGCPASTATGALGPVTEKSSITKLIEFELPADGAGLETVTLTEPTAVRSVAAIAAVS